MSNEITWIKCSERMPPDDEKLIIVRDRDGYVLREGYIVNAWRDIFDETAEWTPYTLEIWRQLKG